MRIMTIGGYGFTEESFMLALRDARVDTFVDVRRRRGMRGARYAFLNSSRLQQLLGSIGITYVHELELAPTTSVRDAQRLDDLERGITKRDRDRLSPRFVTQYHSEILAHFDAGRFRALLNDASVVALFCVEGNPAACHRSLAAEHLVRVLESERPVVHLAP